MVLKNSKWDKRAKYKYMKKHGISIKPKLESSSEPRAKWTSKKSTDSNFTGVVLEDSDDEWDTETEEALINHFYPQIGETELTPEQKLKIRKQILADIDRQLDEDEAGEEDQFNKEISDEEDVELDGIYLGSKENEEREMAPEVQTKFNLNEFMAGLDLNKTKKNRKMLKNKVTDNFLEEYGLSSYDEITKKTDDYNSLYYSKLEHRSIKDIPASDLDGFRVGQDSLADISRKKEKSSHIRYMTEEEQEQEKERAIKAELAKLHNELRSRLGSSKKPTTTKKNKVIVINNINEHDSEQMASLNSRIVNSAAAETHSSDDDDSDLDADIDYLLYGDTARKHENTSKNSRSTQLTDIVKSNSFEDLLAGAIGANIRANSKSKIPTETQPKSVNVPLPPQDDIDFLDDLLA